MTRPVAEAAVAHLVVVVSADLGVESSAPAKAGETAVEVGWQAAVVVERREGRSRYHGSLVGRCPRLRAWSKGS
jgi:hypothetical protein